MYADTSDGVLARNTSLSKQIVNQSNVSQQSVH